MSNQDIIHPALMPCPFDGTPAEYRVITEKWGYTPEMVYVQCPHCGVKSPHEDAQSWTTKNGHFETRTEAYCKVASWWNRRP